jgi:uncharacterized protein (DUF2252 family)
MRILSDADRHLILTHFLDGYGVNHLRYLHDYKWTVDEVNGVIRSTLKECLAIGRPQWMREVESCAGNERVLESKINERN